MSDQVFKLSICIPTYNRCRYLFKLLSGITSQEEFLSGRVQICISNNASTDETEAVSVSFVNKFPKFIKYIRQERNIGGDNFQAVLSIADGEYLKINNDTLMHEEGSLSYFLQEINNNKEKFPMVFSNNLKATVQGLDQFVRTMSYHVTYIGGFGIWRRELQEILGATYLTEQLWQVEVIFSLVSSNKKTLIRPLKNMKISTPEKAKGGYPFNKVFIDSYLILLQSSVMSNEISNLTYQIEKKKVLIDFCAPWAGLSIAREGSNFKIRDHFNYLLKWYKDRPLVIVNYFIHVFLHSIKSLTRKTLSVCKQHFFSN